MSAEADGKADGQDMVLRVAFQGEKGAYSEAAIFELLGRRGIEPKNYAEFDDAFEGIMAGEADLLMVPIENSLGGTIHANCDLQIKHSLFIIAEHDFRVRHCLMALPGTQKSALKKIISHPQALAQCDSYINRLEIPREKAYDTAGSAKLISEGKLVGVGAICSEVAASYYGLEILDKGIEDDPNNFTRFLLLRKSPVRIPPGMKCKTSIAFSLDNVAGALFKALSVFALREIDLVKIESRPCKPDVMDKLERLFWQMGGMMMTSHRHFREQASDEPAYKKQRGQGAVDAQHTSHYRYLFYVDFLASTEEPNAANALKHLQEITTFFRILGTYPRGGTLVGLGNLGPKVGTAVRNSASSRPRRRLGIIGFGTFGQFLARKMVDFEVYATSRDNYSGICAELGVAWCTSLEDLLKRKLDILLISVSILSFESIVRKVSAILATMPESATMLVVDVCSVKVHPKTIMSALLPPTCDILCTHPMFGPQSGKHGWTGLPFVYERVRLLDAPRCEDFLRWWGEQGCRMVDMTCETHDECAAGSQFVTHFTGRVLSRLGLRTTPINTKGFESLLHLVENTCRDSFDLFYALYKCNPNSAQQLKAFEDAMADVSQELRAETVKGAQL